VQDRTCLVVSLEIEVHLMPYIVYTVDTPLLNLQNILNQPYFNLLQLQMKLVNVAKRFAALSFFRTSL